jgi:alkanesulfonate monooxygenase SsuD/methylene tetrahydromethanopterin reductase-like flavin-dependent oxidoreductase (luciferase family)
MRRQYHFVPGETRLDAWDVHRLIEVARVLPVEQLNLEDLEPEYAKVYWFGPDQPPTVRSVVEHGRLIDEADLRHPIILGSDGRVMDGMHRIAKAFRDGHDTISAVRFLVDPEPDHRDCIPSELSYESPEPA